MLEHVTIPKQSRTVTVDVINRAVTNRQFRKFVKEIAFCTTSIVKRNAPEDYEKADRMMVNLLDKLERFGMHDRIQQILRFAHKVEDAGHIERIPLMLR